MVSLEIVLPNGTNINASTTENEDIFWAIRVRTFTRIGAHQFTQCYIFISLLLTLVRHTRELTITS